MSIAEVVQSSWLFVGTLEWDPDRCNPRWTDTVNRDVPSTQGVYVWLDDSGRVQKVGKAEGNGGLRGRYSWGRGNPQKDSTTRLWESKWGSGPMKGKKIRVYFSPHPPAVTLVDVPGFGPIEVPSHVARGVEKTLSQWARNDGEPMELAGAGD